MLKINVTENYGGIEVKGDYYDFEQLYDSIFKIIGDGEDYEKTEKCFNNTGFRVALTIK